MRKFKINVNGTDYDVAVEEIVDGNVVPVSAPIVNTVAAVKVATPKQTSSGKGKAVNCPMPGTIMKLNFADGSSVKKGQPIVVLEAMKMENDIVADCDGVVKYAVAKGASVETGDVLAYIE